MKKTRTRDQEEKRTELLKTVALADDGMAGYDRTTCPYCTSNIIDDFCQIFRRFNGHWHGGIRPYHPPIPVRKRNFKLRRELTVSLTGIGTGASARTRSRFLIVRKPTYPTVETTGMGGFAPYCPPVPRRWRLQNIGLAGGNPQTSHSFSPFSLFLSKNQTLIP
jgi:hypothetical protein